jgi:hypothetical protein
MPFCGQTMSRVAPRHGSKSAVLLPQCSGSGMGAVRCNACCIQWWHGAGSRAGTTQRPAPAAVGTLNGRVRWQVAWSAVLM